MENINFDNFLTLREKSQLQTIGSFGYRCYSIPREALDTFPHKGNWAIADPLADEEGFYLVVNTIEEAFTEMDDNELLNKPD